MESHDKCAIMLQVGAILRPQPESDRGRSHEPGNISSRLAWTAAVLLSLPPILLPLHNPDIFWHLSSGRWMVENFAFPRGDFLSFTSPGAAWVDFEWLSQLIYHVVFRSAGMSGLWLLKLMLLSASAAAMLALLRRHAVPPAWRAAALVLWSAGNLAYADIRPDLFSLAGYSTLLAVLEARRLEGRTYSVSSLAGIGFAFMLWANLHGGFAFGLVLLLLYGAALPLAVAVTGTLVNPYGWGVYRIMAQHWADRKGLTLFVQEWHPTMLSSRWQTPFWVILILFLIVLAVGIRTRRKLPAGLTMAALIWGGQAVLHSRMSVYFQATAIPLIFILVKESGWRAMWPPWRVRLGLGTGCLLYLAYLTWLLPQAGWGGFFEVRRLPRAAADFLSQQKPVTSQLRIYNPWEWGGYLGWRLYPWHKVYRDGRYLFHHLLLQDAAAYADAGRFQEYLGEHSISGTLIENASWRVSTRKIYPDGTTKEFLRPWYLSYFPRAEWALVYWDLQALVFVKRAAVPVEWLRRYEYRYVRPGDESAFAEALEMRELPVKRVAAEKKRHDAEAAYFWSIAAQTRL